MSKYISSFVICINLFIFSSAFAQNYGVISGRITEKGTNEPLVGANIYTKSDYTIGDVSDFNGHYSISLPPGKYTIVVSFTGMKKIYKDVDIKSGEHKILNFEMEPFSIMFQEVEIRAGSFKKKLEEQTASIEVIKPKLIEDRNTRNISSILNLTPGVTILDEEPQIRGGSGFTFGVGSKVGVFIDGMPVITGDAGKPDWSLIPVENIKQVEVVKGASSVLAGSSAMNGVIYIQTNFPGVDPKTRVQIYTGMHTAPKAPAVKWWNGINDFEGANFFHSRRLGKGNTDLVIGGVIATDRNYTGAPIPNPGVIDTNNITDSDMRENKARFNFSLRRRPVKIKGLNFGLNGTVMYRHQAVAMAWLNDTNFFYRAYPGAVLLSDVTTTYFDPYINFYTPSGTKHQFTNRILYRNSDAIKNQSNSALMIYNKYQIRKRFDNLGNLEFIGALISNYTKSNSNMYEASGSPVNSVWNSSLVMQFEKKFGSSLILSMGARVEHFALNDSIVETKPIFRMGTTMKLGQETFLRASFGQGYRFPTITERYIRTKMGSFAVFNNPDLKSETSWNTEIGVKQGLKFYKFYGYLDIAAFYQFYNNTIEYLFGFWDLDYAAAGFKFLNTGKSRVTGLDISFTGQAKFNKNTGANIISGYTYVNPIALEPDYVFTTDDRGKEYSYNTMSVDPSKKILKYRYLHTVKFDLSFYYKAFDAGISLRYYSKLVNLDKTIFLMEEATESSGGTLQPILYKNYFYHHNNGNAIFDARCSYTFKKKHKLAFIVKNLFNRMYSLRALKAEPMRSVSLQYTLNL